MYRPYSCLVIILCLSGCVSVEGERLADASSDVLERTGEVINQIINGSDAEPRPVTEIYEEERRALFDQPYIDPLTGYLIEHSDDPERAAVRERVRQERDRRCEDVAAQYTNEPATEDVLERYDAGYAYSCPEQVAAFEERVLQVSSQSESESEPKSESAPATADAPTGDGVSEQALSDCYLLTTIRNYSAARKACLEPADSGDIRSQANMALIAHAFEDYPAAREWAEKAAPASGDAAFLLGQMYATGRGVGQDLEQALYWYNEAARMGHKEAQAALDRHLEDIPAGDT